MRDRRERAGGMTVVFNLITLVRRMKIESIVAVAIFLVGAIGGALFAPELASIVKPMYQSLHQKAMTLSSDTPWQLMWALFSNNFRASILMMVGGLLLGVIPALYVFANGALVGFVLLVVTSATHANPMLVFLAGIVPHGIFEIPAYLLATAFGFRVTQVLFRSIAGRGNKAMWGQLVLDAVSLLLWVLVLLLVAAYMESHVTPLVLRLVLHKSV